MRIDQSLYRLGIKLRILATDLRGQDMVEYALMAAFVAVAAGAIFPTSVAPNISTIYSKVTSLMDQT